MMKLYYAPGACSLADHIALLEAGAKFEAEAIDIKTKKTASGEDFLVINPKGYVPALVLESGETLTENIAVLDWIADQFEGLRPTSTMARTRQLEMLAFISTELHRSFKPFWHGGGDAEKASAREAITRLFELVEARQVGDYLLGERLSVADCYLFVMLRWAERFGVTAPEALLRLQWRMEQRPSVQTALGREEAASPRRASQKVEGGAVRENSAEHRFERPIHNGAVAVAYYRTQDGRLVFTHTEVPPAFSGQGIATELARGAFELLRASGRKAILVCPFMVSFANAHPEFGDVIVG